MICEECLKIIFAPFKTKKHRKDADRFYFNEILDNALLPAEVKTDEENGEDQKMSADDDSWLEAVFEREDENLCYVFDQEMLRKANGESSIDNQRTIELENDQESLTDTEATIEENNLNDFKSSPNHYSNTFIPYKSLLIKLLTVSLKR